ncbi:MAG TPA: HlyD family efflux transporter periplasmic adaptor subunit [Bacteroidia bacterium]|nr:HlyD family efflux transporter periplasmic adaptor subunit [Bacteroidia bacterium]
MKKKLFYTTFTLFAFIFLAIAGCKNKVSSSDDDVKAVSSVRVTSISQTTISDQVSLSATSSFLIKDAARAIANGYIQNTEVNIGDKVKKGQVLFTMQTKEASAIGNTKDSSFSFSGILKIIANKDGIITTMNHQKGDYVQDGDQLCMIADENSLVFLLSVPYELHDDVKINELCTIILPDSEQIKAKIDSRLPTMDELSQTENYIVKPISEIQLPENLIAKIVITKSTKKNAFVLPKTAILTNPTQTDFWVMKLINDSTAVKININKGIESTDKVEIISPVFSASDKIIFSGNYGLTDTASVKIIKP